MVLPGILIIYYTIKSIFIFKQKQFQYQNNLSDVREIVRDTENESYIDEDSRKTYREKTVEEEKIRNEILKSQSIRRKKKLEKRKR